MGEFAIAVYVYNLGVQVCNKPRESSDRVLYLGVGLRASVAENFVCQLIYMYRYQVHTHIVYGVS